MSDALTDTAAAATPIPRLPLPTFRIAREPAATQPRAIGRWLEQKVSNGDWGRLNAAELLDLRTAAMLLEAWEMPVVKPWWKRIGRGR